MASQGKSKRRTKGRTLDLQAFLNEDQTAPDGFTVVTTLNWADCCDDSIDRNSVNRTLSNKIILPSGPKSVRAPEFDVSKVPHNPPFKACLGNLPYDVTEEEITRFFRRLKVKDVQLVTERSDKTRPRGYGYAEFEDRENLIEALQQNGDILKNRSIRVSLSSENDTDRHRRTGDSDRDDPTAGDWRSGPREEMSRDNSRRDGPTRNGSDNSHNEQEPYRARSSYDRDRRSGGMDRNFPRNDRGDYVRSDGKSFDRVDERRGYRENRFGSGFDKKSGATRRYTPGESYEEEKNDEPPKERPKLVLAPRTLPIDTSTAPTTPSAIFGDAKPVDTASKEREIEERMRRDRSEVDNENVSIKGSRKIANTGKSTRGDSNSRDE